MFLFNGMFYFNHAPVKNRTIAGVQLGGVSDQLGQQYNSPRQMVTENHVDIIIVGRGILNAEDPVAVARQYQHAGFDAYEDLLQ